MPELTDAQAEAIDQLILESSQRLVIVMDELGMQARPSAWDALNEELDDVFRAFLQRLEAILAKEG
jgi:hypothetical protein